MSCDESRRRLPPPFIHPSSVVHRQSTLGRGVHVGPFSVIGPHVTLGEGTRLISHVAVFASTSLGRNCVVYPNTTLGSPPQDLKYAGEEEEEDSRLLIGDDVIIRENVTINVGTKTGDGGGCKMPTRIGDRVRIMSGAHIAHDCHLDDDVLIITGVGLAGHVTVGRGAIVAGQAGVHQWCRIGTLAFVAGGSKVTRDVLPFSTVQGDRAKTVGINTEGLIRRRDTDRISAVEAAMKTYFAEGQQGLLAKLKDCKENNSDADIRHILEFAKISARGICPPKYISRKASARI